MRFERNEYPRPQFRRDNWQNLNGEWEFEFDDKDEGVVKKYYLGKKFTKKINVPFTYQYEASGINDKTVHDIVWYKRTFFIEKENQNKNVLLCFNGVDYIADVWVNGIHVLNHKGAYSEFKCDITKFVKNGENLLAVRCEDRLEDDQPRGKQSWTGKTYGCWYVANTGIWQSVWLEFFKGDCINEYHLLSDYDNTAFYGDITTLYGKADTLKIIATFEGKVRAEQTVKINQKFNKYYVKLQKSFLEDLSWWQDCPRLIYVDFVLLKGNKVLDLAHTRFGLRKVSVSETGAIYLNGRPFYQRLVLDQGYWNESGITPPSAEALKEDIELAKAMGFNGARKHQKIEDPYFYYYAEELGYVTWCEMPSAYNYNDKETQAIMTEWQEIVNNAKNFTSNICYLPINESWGIREVFSNKDQRDFVRSLYYITKAMDDGKLVSSNDGFEVVNPTDILGIHDYDSEKEEHFKKYHEWQFKGMHPQGFALYAQEEDYQGQPVLLTEFGGRAFLEDKKGDAWGYSKALANEDEFLAQLESIMKGVYSCRFQGFCYTQLTDVQQEVNGLLYADRRPKVSVEKLKKIFENK